jgi:ABC-type amino acid transport substrate-binding protein
VASSIVLQAVQEEFGDRLTILPTLPAAVDAVLTGKAAAVIADDVAVSRWLDANPAAGLQLELVTRRDRRPGLAMAVHWKSDDLQAWLNLCIEKCALDGTLHALATKYLGHNRP